MKIKPLTPIVGAEIEGVDLVDVTNTEVLAIEAALHQHGVVFFRDQPKLEPEQQIARAMKRSGETREQVQARLDRQMPVEEKLKVADCVVDTSGTKEATREQVVKIHQQLRSTMP